MEVSKEKLTSGNVCCFGISQVGVPVATVVAHNCPSLSISVVDLSADKIMLWNTKQMLIHDPKVDEMLRKTENRNLIFTPNTTDAIKKADIILISIESPTQSRGPLVGKLMNICDIEKAIRLIAKESENNKIIAVKSTVPVGTSEILQRILSENKSSQVQFQVLSVPEFFCSGYTVQSLLKPDKVLIGSDLSEEALKATDTLTSLYASWIPRQRILTVNRRSAELTKIMENAFLAQKFSSVNSLSLICEKYGANLREVLRIIRDSTGIVGDIDDLEPSLGFGGHRLKKNLLYLIQFCEEMNLPESAEHWRQVLVMNEYHERIFFKRILYSFFNTLLNKKIALWGFGFKKNSEFINDALAINLCLNLLEEGATVSVCDPKVDWRQALSELQAAGLQDSRAVAYCDDPYKAARKANAIVVLKKWEDLKTLNYNYIYKDMMRPAHIFDARMCLPHEDLQKIGFLVQTIGLNLNDP